jgi:hypothetical protein
VTAQELLLLAVFVLLVVGVWLTLFYLLPLIARAKFEYRATVLRDTCVDALHDGLLPSVDPVREFLSRASYMATHADAFTLTRAIAAHYALAELGYDGGRPPTYASLRPEERRLLHELDSELHRALGDRLIRGSSFGWILWLGVLVLRRFRSMRNQGAAAQAAPSAEDLAREYSEVSDRVHAKGHKLVLASH